MDSKIILEIIIFQIVFLIALIILIINLVRLSKAIKAEKRIEPFALLSISENQLSFFDNISNKIVNFLNKIGNHIIKFKLFKKQSLKYEKYISANNKNINSSIFIPLKYLIAIVFLMITMVTTIFRFNYIYLIIYLIVFMLGYYLVDIFLYFKQKRKKIKIENDLINAISIMNESFKVGKTILQAIKDVTTSLQGSIADEFQKIYLDITYGLSLEIAFNRFYQRIKLKEIKYISSTLTLAERTGGDIISIFNNIEETFFDKNLLKKELNSTTSAACLVYRLLLIIPLIFVTLILMININYFKILYTTFVGFVIMILILLLYILYILLIKKVMKVDIL